MLPEETAQYYWRARLPFSVNVLAEEAAVLTVVNPFAASALGIIAAGEDMTPFKLAGYILVLAALVLYNLKTKAEKGSS